MNLYMRLPKNEPKLIGSIIEDIVNKDFIQNIEYAPLKCVFNILPVYRETGISSYQRTWHNNTDTLTSAIYGDKTKIAESEIKRVIDHWELVIDRDMYKRELKKPNLRIRHMCAEKVLDFAVSEHIGRGSFISGIVGIASSIASTYLMIKHTKWDKETIAILATIIGIVVGTALYTFYFVPSTRNKYYKYYSERALSLGYFTYDTEEAKVPLNESIDLTSLAKQSKTIFSNIFKFLAKDEFGRARTTLNAFIKKAYPTGTASQKSAIKLSDNLFKSLT